MSADLAKKLQLGLDELAIIQQQLAPLISLPVASAGVIERAAACAMLHSFYTEIEKLLKLIAREWGGEMPSSEAWHRKLLNQMSVPTPTRPAVLSPTLIEVLGEFLAFRHVFRGASIVLTQWEKIQPLLAKVRQTYDQTEAEIRTFIRLIKAPSESERHRRSPSDAQ